MSECYTPQGPVKDDAARRDLEHAFATTLTPTIPTAPTTLATHGSISAVIPPPPVVPVDHAKRDAEDDSETTTTPSIPMSPSTLATYGPASVVTPPPPVQADNQKRDTQCTSETASSTVSCLSYHRSTYGPIPASILSCISEELKTITATATATATSDRKRHDSACPTEALQPSALPSDYIKGDKKYCGVIHSTHEPQQHLALCCTGPLQVYGDCFQYCETNTRLHAAFAGCANQYIPNYPVSQCNFNDVRGSGSEREGSPRGWKRAFAVLGSMVAFLEA